MNIEEDIKLDFDDVLLKPKRSTLTSRADVDLMRKFRTPNSNRDIVGLPIISANMDTTGTFAMAKVLEKDAMFTALHKHYPPEQLIEHFSQNPLYSFYTLGIKDNDIEKLKFVNNKTPIDKICIDVANGYSEAFVHKILSIREFMPNAIIMAGNVATPEMVQELIISGAADIVKIGIGPGSVCTTRKVSGVGYPQLSCIMECADAAHGLNGLVCADGGIKSSGDVVKAFAAGADFIMIGGYFAGYEENEGEWEYKFEEVLTPEGWPRFTGNKVKKCLKFYGMSSKEAMDKYSNGVQDYKTSEGKCTKIPYKGPIKDAVQEILGGLRSGCTYVGASRLKDLSKCATFIRVNRVHYQNT